MNDTLNFLQEINRIIDPIQRMREIPAKTVKQVFAEGENEVTNRDTGFLALFDDQANKDLVIIGPH